MKVTFHIESTTAYTVDDDSPDVLQEPGYDGRLIGIVIDRDGAWTEYWHEPATVFAANQDDYDAIVAAAKLAGVMLPEDGEDPDLTLMFGGRQ